MAGACVRAAPHAYLEAQQQAGMCQSGALLAHERVSGQHPLASVANIGSGAFQSPLNRVAAAASRAASVPVDEHSEPHARPSAITVADVRARLGERTFTILRHAMLAQQEAWIEQLWELHRLARTQARRVSLLATDLDDIATAQDACNAMLDRQRQAQARAHTMSSILSMPTVPVSLRRATVSGGGSNTNVAGSSAAEASNQATEVCPGTQHAASASQATEPSPCTATGTASVAVKPAGVHAHVGGPRPGAIPESNPGCHSGLLAHLPEQQALCAGQPDSFSNAGMGLSSLCATNNVGDAATLPSPVLHPPANVAALLNLMLPTLAGAGCAKPAASLPSADYTASIDTGFDPHAAWMAARGASGVQRGRHLDVLDMPPMPSGLDGPITAVPSSSNHSSMYPMHGCDPSASSGNPLSVAGGWPMCVADPPGLRVAPYQSVQAAALRFPADTDRSQYGLVGGENALSDVQRAAYTHHGVDLATLAKLGHSNDCCPGSGKRKRAESAGGGCKPGFAADGTRLSKQEQSAASVLMSLRQS